MKTAQRTLKPEPKPLDEIPQLKARLREAEETLAAIRNGKVDALVVQGPDGERIYTLKGADQPYRILVQEMREGAATLSPDGLILYSNRRFAELVGAPLDRVIGSRFEDYIAAGDASRAADLLRGAAAGASRGEVILRAANGSAIPVFLSFSSLEIEDTRIVCLVVTDLTELKRADELMVAETLSRAILEQAAEAVVVVEDGGRIIRASRSAAALAFGAGILYRQFDDAFPFQATGQQNQWLFSAHDVCQAACEGQIIRGLEVLLPRKDKSPAFFLCTAGPLTGPGGESLGCVVTLTEITERKGLEDQIRQSQKLESIGLLAGGIAHDFNNLLTGIIGNASLVLDTIDASPETAHQCLEQVVEAGQRAANLTRQLLAYAGRGQVFSQPVEISAVVRALLPLIRTSLPSGADISLDLTENLPPTQADRSQIEQVIMNLVINAGEALGEANGRILIRTSLDELRRAGADSYRLQPGRYVCLEVSDTGTGMDEATRARIFEPFFTTKFTGRGLGLAAVDGIVRTSKGGIKVESRPGRGTRFSVLFPVATQPARQEPVLETSSPEGSGVVLVADDDDVVRSTAQAILRRFGFTVRSVSNGREAVDLFAADPDGIDAVLLDVKMPVMDGHQAFVEMKRIRPDVKVLVSSGYNEDAALRDFPASEVASFLQKPYRAADLARTVKAVIGKQAGARR